MRTMADRKTKGAMLVAGVMAFYLFAAIASGVQANSTERWDGGLLKGWTNDELNGSLGNPSDYLQLSFPSQGLFLMPSLGAVAGGIDASGGVFSGDYTSIGASNITFSMMTDGHLPAAIWLVLRGAVSGREWSYSALELSDIPGVWVTNTVSLLYSANKWRLGGDDGTEAMFRADLSNVASIGIRIQQNGPSAQVYCIDEFCLQGANLYESIRGHVTYAGLQFGPVRVVACTDAGGWTGSNVTVQIKPGNYELTGVKTVTNIWVKAYVDANTNGIADTWEPVGQYPANPLNLVASLDNVDITLSEMTMPGGFPLWWGMKYLGITEGSGGSGGSEVLPDADLDGDGMNNQQEYIAGTNPDDGASVFKAKVESQPSGTGILLKWDSPYYYQTFAVWRCSDLLSGFSLLQGGVTSTPPQTVFEDLSATGEGPYFYKIKIE